MESKQQKQQSCSSPFPNPPSSPSSFFRDISNFKTPKQQRHSQTNPSFNLQSPCPKFFTASKETPKSSSSTVRRRPRPSLTAQRLKAFQLEQSKSSRKNQTSKEKSLKSLAKSLTVWLNFLFENPRSWGVDISKLTGEDCSNGSSVAFSGGKRESLPHSGVEVDRQWRDPKRRKDSLWVHKGEVEDTSFSTAMYLRLQVSLRDVCSLDDLKERMGVYLSLTSCKEILDVMTQVAKNIDEGRLKMKAHCPLVTDVGLKGNSLRILMSYNPVWLRIGLYIVVGGESLLPKPNVDVNSEQETAFLKTVIDKLFFSHAGLAKSYVYNKLVDGLYRPGYYEELGTVILKRFLLLVLILDRAKSQSSLPISYGIDGLDGGSPILFTLRSNIKSSREMISDFLSSDVMHGVGNILAHLAILGYKVSHHQNPLVEYVFKVTDLFDDLQDGVLLCRAIQLLEHDSSILKKVIVPSDDRKKNLVNCGISLQHLKQAGVPLYDEDGTEIIVDDIVNGDKELTVSLLWNMFVHLQLPLLINNEQLADEITKIRGTGTVLPNTLSLLEMLLEWIQAICENYDFKVENFASLVDGKAMWCLLDYYFRKYHFHATNKDLDETNGEVPIMSASDYADAVHNFILSQKLTTILGNFPEVLQVSDILEYKGACSERGVVILLVFLSSQLITKRNMDPINFHKLLGHIQTPERKYIRRDRWVANFEATLDLKETCQKSSEDNVRNFKAIMTWWKEMAQHNSKSNVKPVCLALQRSSGRKSSDAQRENAAKIIQSHFRRSVECRKYTKIRNAVYILQAVIRAWLMVKKTSAMNKFSGIKVQEPSYDKHKLSRSFCRYKGFMVDRHAFVKLIKSVVIIQHAIRSWIAKRHQNGNNSILCNPDCDITNAAATIQKCICACTARSTCIHGVTKKAKIVCQKNEMDEAAARIQLAWRKHLSNSLHSQNSAATIIQAHCRGWLSRKSFMNKMEAVRKLQRFFRYLKYMRNFEHYKLATRSAVTIQSHARGWMARRVTYRDKCLIILIQSHCRGWLVRRELLLQKEAAVRIQIAFRCLKGSKAFHYYRHAAIEIQRFIRGCITRKRLLGASNLRKGVGTGYRCEAQRGCFHSHELRMYVHSVLKLQRWWRGILLTKARTRSAVVVQSHVRGWIARRITAQRRRRIAVIQSYWKGYIERKNARGKLCDIRLRVQKAAANVDDGMRIINRLIAALLELKSMKSVSGILHTCATLDMATEHSQKCCEKLVAAGAIETLLGLICSVSRSIPDQEVLRHTLSTLRNLTRHPHLTETLIDTDGSVQTILWEFIRNKEEAYFITAELLRNICSSKKGVERIRSLHALIKRLHNHVEDLKRKAGNEKKNARMLAAKEQTDRRLREAVEILKLITNV